MQLIEHPGARPRRKSRKGIVVSLLVIAALAGAWAVLTLNFAGWPGLAMLNGIVTTAQTLTGLALAFVVLRMPAVERRTVGAVEASAPASSPAPA